MAFAIRNGHYKNEFTGDAKKFGENYRELYPAKEQAKCDACGQVIESGQKYVIKVSGTFCKPCARKH